MTREAKRTPKRPLATDSHRLKRTRRGQAVSEDVRGRERFQRSKNGVSRHRPISPLNARLMAACDARRVSLGLSFRALARDVGLDHADVIRALSLKEEPTSRTIRRLCESLNIADAPGLSHRERRTALLNQMNAALARLVELNAAFIGELKGEE